MKLAFIIITAILLYVLYQVVGYEVASRMLGGGEPEPEVLFV